MTLSALLCGALAGCNWRIESSGGPVGGSTPLQTLRFEALDGRIDVLVAHEVVRLSEQEEVDLQASIAEALNMIDDRLSLPRTQVIVEADATRAIPEIGVGGFTEPRGGVVHLYVDPDYRSPMAVFREEGIPATLAHELHHATRILRGPGYGRTLLQALVTEGMAEAFALEVYPEVKRSEVPWLYALTRSEEKELWTDAIRALHRRRYGHRRWFFGTGDIPRWAGYTIAFNLVSGYLKRSERTAAESVGIPAARVMAVSPYPRRG